MMSATYKTILPKIILLSGLSFIPNLRAELPRVGEFDVYFPQVARGTLGVYIETQLVISNPSSEAAEITLESFGVELPVPSVFQLGPAETREIRFEGEPLQVGWVRLKSRAPVSAAAHISIRPNRTSNQVLSHISILAQPLVSKAVIPVFLKTPIADNTGFALARRQSGRFRFTLYDPTGKQIAAAIDGFDLGALSEHAAMFVTDLFPQIPSNFTIGSLVVEHWSPGNIAMAFAITALYTRGTDLASAAVVGVDDPRFFVIFLKSSVNIADQANQLADQYGFKVDPLDNWVSGLMTHEIARAVSRDKRVDRVEPVTAVVLSQ